MTRHHVINDTESLAKMTEYHTSLVYNTHIRRWITVDVDWQKRQLGRRRSPDPLNFHVPTEPVFQSGEGDTVAYTSVLPPEGDLSACGREFYVIFRNHGVQDETGKAFYHVKRLKIAFE